MKHLFRAAVVSAAFALAVPAALAQDAGAPEIPADTEIVTTASGLKYSVLKKGEDGAKSPKAGDDVSVHYTGWTTDGKVFDSSRTRGAPTTFMCGGQLIKAWNEALPLMKIGDQLKLTVPPDLGYGAPGNPPAIPGGATLIFEMELLSITEGPALPVFDAYDDAKAKDSGLGFRYQILQSGGGVCATEESVVEVHIVLWTPEGDTMESTWVRKVPVKAPVAAFRQQLLKDAVQLVSPGGNIRCQAPAKTVFGARLPPNVKPEDTFYLDLQLLKVIEPMPLPEFVLPGDDELKTTESGLKYQVVRPGRPDGKTPKMGESVTCHYAGWLTGGKNFDASFKRGEPMSFQLGRVIPGWNEGLQLMQEGAVYRFVIPGNLAYGERGAPPDIGPNATLVFYVELISVGKSE